MRVLEEQPVSRGDKRHAAARHSEQQLSAAIYAVDNALIRADCAGEVGLIGPIESPSAVEVTSTTSDASVSTTLKVPPPLTQ